MKIGWPRPRRLIRIRFLPRDLSNRILAAVERWVVFGASLLDLRLLTTCCHQLDSFFLPQFRPSFTHTTAYTHSLSPRLSNAIVRVKTVFWLLTRRRLRYDQYTAGPSHLVWNIWTLFCGTCLSLAVEIIITLCSISEFGGALSIWVAYYWQLIFHFISGFIALTTFLLHPLRLKTRLEPF